MPCRGRLPWSGGAVARPPPPTPRGPALTSRERLIAAAHGIEVDRKPVICWPTFCAESDATISDRATPIALPGFQLNLVPVLNPFGRALREGTEIGDILAEDPDRGEEMLAELISQTRTAAADALDKGADGILYLLYGARAIHTTPMEYGGHYLERDRELLSEIENATFNMVFVVGEEDTYLDFVSDLPAHAFGWDRRATGTSVDDMRKMRDGALATNSPDADIELRFGTESLAAELELELSDYPKSASFKPSGSPIRDPKSAIYQEAHAI